MSLVLPPFRKSVGGFYEIRFALELKAASSQHLTRTFPVAGDRKTFTAFFWYRRSTVIGSQYEHIFGVAGTDYLYFYYDNIAFLGLGGGLLRRRSNAVFRDPSAAYAIQLAVDTRPATPTIRIWIDGTEITSWQTSSDPAQNAESTINSAALHYLGRSVGGYYCDGVISDFHFLDGIAATEHLGGQFDANGKWHPKKYTGSYGATGFHLDFANAADLGNDTSGNNNDWTLVNAPIQTLDTPTNVYARLDPTGFNGGTAPTISNAGLTVTGGQIAKAGIAIPDGDWYWEVKAEVVNGVSPVGIANEAASTNTYVGQDANSWGYQPDGQKRTNGVASAYGSAFTTGAQLCVAVRRVAGSLSIWFGQISGGVTTWQNGGNPVAGTGAAFTGITGTILAASCSQNTTPKWTFNFGDKGNFAGTQPSGFKALCTKNLPKPAIADPGKHFDIALWTGNGAARTILTETKPGIVWGKTRGVAVDHQVFDILRGAGKNLITNKTNAEGNDLTALSGFLDDGFTLGTDQLISGMNYGGRTEVGWVWGGMTQMTAPEIAALVTATGAGSTPTGIARNVAAGFAVITYTGTGAARTLPNPLGNKPGFWFLKDRSTGNSNWPVYHQSQGATKRGGLNTTAAFDAQDWWQSTEPTANLIYLSSNTNVNANGVTYVMYVFAAIEGFSAFGSYIGNGAVDGPRIVLPFRPAFMLTKASSAAYNWTIVDDVRDPFNPAGQRLYTNYNNAEDSTADWKRDFLANGVKFRQTHSEINASAVTYVYAAFARHPFGGGSVAPVPAR